MNHDSPPSSPAAGLRLLHASLSDIGCRREKNEDAVGIFACEQPPGALLLVVADGVGGNAGGARASELAVGRLPAAYYGLTNGDPTHNLRLAFDRWLHLPLHPRVRTHPEPGELYRCPGGSNAVLHLFDPFQ